MPPADRLRGAATRTGPFLAAAIVVQWLSTVIAALRATNDGWRFEQSPEAIASVQGAFDLVSGALPREGPGIVWPIVLSPVASVADTTNGVLAGAVLLNVVVLAPVALVAAYWIAAKIGGRLLGSATVALWLLAPWLLYVLALAPYDPVVRDRVLPLVLGLTAEPAFPAAVALVAAAALISTAQSHGSLRTAAVAGLVAGAAVAIEPHSLLFLGGAAGAYVANRRIRELGAFAVALAPAVLTVLLWQARALDGPDALSFGPVDWGQFTSNMAGLREFFWSQRLLQWLPLAGTIAVARRSWPLALLLGGWMLSFGVVQGSHPAAGLEDGAIFRVLLPTLPAYILLAVAIPLLVPTLAARLGGSLDPLVPSRRPGWNAVAIAAVVLAALPLATAALGSS